MRKHSHAYSTSCSRDALRLQQACKGIFLRLLCQRGLWEAEKCNDDHCDAFHDPVPPHNFTTGFGVGWWWWGKRTQNCAVPLCIPLRWAICPSAGADVQMCVCVRVPVRGWCNAKRKLYSSGEGEIIYELSSSRKLYLSRQWAQANPRAF